MKRRLFPIAFLILFAATPASAWRGVVESVNSCDSVVIAGGPPGQGLNVRLYGIECPALSPGEQGERGGQPYSEQCLTLLRALLPKDLPVTVHDMRQDTMGRNKGSMITLPGGKTVQEELLRAGLAWVAPLHCGNCWKWKRLQKAAKEARIGLWQDENPIAPWQWREGVKAAP